VVTAIVLILLVAIAVGFAFVPGLAPLAIVPAILAIAYASWVIVGLRKGRTPGGAVRRHRRVELLGPGGPDDPDSR
jgi:hypothetical protein